MFGHRHKWTDWNITERGSIGLLTRPDIKVGTYILQDRHCLGCGKTELDRQIVGVFYNGTHQLIPESAKNKPKHDKVDG